MGARSRYKQIQGEQNRTYGSMEYMKWQNMIFDEAGVTATVMLKDGQISLRTKNYADYILARSVLMQKTAHPIVRDPHPI